jgi:hypothetical protein
VAVNPFTGEQVGQGLDIAVSPDSQLSANTTLTRGQQADAAAMARTQAGIAAAAQRQAMANANAMQRQQMVSGNRAPQQAQAQAEAEMVARDVLNQVGRAKGMLGFGTTGVSGAVAGLVPFIPTQRRALEGTLDSIKSSLSFGELARLRAQGVTLGSVTEKELEGLASQVAKLDPSLPEAELRRQLGRIETRYSQLFPSLQGQQQAAPAGRQTYRYNPATGRIE